ncbi:hypothetical protein [Variovorax ginsengisoli]|uniref:Uncharacterized protein n=1 Tax=Variovorax ginsengisoli TaxID=363844 RepID=A0ABT8RZ10_9BURK|nr:hypothetical protein [Variovorax ginsengisoli]MDN8612740.1 hypothetical protein [Variovorax ginsengisoli]MDO1531910.1 hypothetical protein [Variovorax ginsengisoli]
MNASEIRIMETHEIAFPFVKESYSGPMDGVVVDDADTWRPGTRREWSSGGDAYYQDVEEWWAADGHGKMVLQVVGRFKPGKYPERTFYLRSFIDPTGRQFGKDKLRVISSAAFKRMLKGYRHEYMIDGDLHPNGGSTQ